MKTPKEVNPRKQFRLLTAALIAAAGAWAKGIITSSPDSRSSLTTDLLDATNRRALFLAAHPELETADE